MELPELLARINQLKEEIDARRPIPQETLDRIMQKFRLDWNFHSNNLEGNSLTFGETKSFLLHGITAEGKPLKDHLDIKGHNEAIVLLDDIIKSEHPLTETFIRGLHKIILHEPYERKAKTPDGQPTTKRIEIGQYKSSPNHVETATGEIFYFATPEETPAKMNDLMDWYAAQIESRKVHPVEIAAKFHYDFIRIHPFDDGNGRIARILMNLILMKFGYLPVVIKTQEKEEYYRALQTADGGDMPYFVRYIAQQLINSLELYLRGAKGENIEELDDIDKKIALLKAKLNSEPIKIFYSDKTQPIVFSTLIIPFLSQTFDKLSQFNDFFRSLIIYIDYKYRDGKKPVRNDYIFSFTDVTTSVQQQSTNKDLLLDIEFRCLFRDFLRTSQKPFNTGVIFNIALDKNSFQITVPEIIPDPITVFYHENYDSQKFKEIVNKIATTIYTDIESKL